MAYAEQKTLPIKEPNLLRTLLSKGLVNLLLDTLASIEGESDQLSLLDAIRRLDEPQNSWLKISQRTTDTTESEQVITIDPLTNFESWPLDCIFLQNEKYILQLHCGSEVIWEADYPPKV